MGNMIVKRLFKSIRSPANLSAEWFRRLINLWPPYLGTGICVKQISKDFKQLTVVMKMRWYNKNAIGKHFGGSLFAMTDPFYMLMLMKIMGSSYVVVDKSGYIEFIQTGQGTVTAQFRLSDADIQQIKDKTANGEKYLPEFVVDIKDADNQVVARVTKTIHIRKKYEKMERP